MEARSESSEAVVRRLRADEASAYRELRLRALADAPLAFGTTLAEASVRPADWWEARAAATSTGSDNAMFVADDAERLHGLAGVMRGEAPRGMDVISMWVDPAWRRRGVGRSLLDAVAAWARAQGATGLQLWVTDGNAPAVALYEAFGFTFTGDRQAHPSQPGLDELLMHRDLDRRPGAGSRP